MCYLGGERGLIEGEGGGVDHCLGRYRVCQGGEVINQWHIVE